MMSSTKLLKFQASVEEDASEDASDSDEQSVVAVRIDGARLDGFMGVAAIVLFETTISPSRGKGDLTHGLQDLTLRVLVLTPFKTLQVQVQVFVQALPSVGVFRKLLPGLVTAVKELLVRVARKRAEDRLVARLFAAVALESHVDGVRSPGNDL